MISRRQFMGRASAAAAYAAFQSKVSFATPLNLPIGIQLYSVREELAKDYDGTLAAVAAAGYTEVEA
ncbi:MAG TPA: twin-arginine translocation signal domain-containing protein, partial [Edaphobacter sp.]|nr:twin-arginine translocation signal domain-containing protein [Edaphobacter sp.]